MGGLSSKENLLLVTGMTMGASVVSFTFSFMYKDMSPNILFTGLILGTTAAAISWFNFRKYKKLK